MTATTTPTKTASAMASSITNASEEAKHTNARRLSAVMGSMKLKFDPQTFNAACDDTPLTEEIIAEEKASKGHQYYLNSSDVGHFPSFGFEVWIDDRHNDGDMEQSICDEMFAIAKLYHDFAEELGQKLDRSPSPSAVKNIAEFYRP